MAQVNQNDVFSDLSYLVGNDIIPNPVPNNWSSFVQRSLERISRIVDFDFGKVVTTLSLTNGFANLPTNARQSPDLDIRVVNSSQNDDYIFTQTTYEQFDNYTQGDYRYYVSTSQDGVQSITTTETGTPAVSVRYSLAAPTINASIATNFPSSMVIAKGALIYIREAEDKDADTGQEEAKFTNELEEVISAMEREQPNVKAVTEQDVAGKQTGEIFEGDSYAFERINTP